MLCHVLASGKHFLNEEMQHSIVNKIKIHLTSKDGIEKFVPRDHR